MVEGNSIRKKILSLRDALPQDEIIEKSLTINKKIISLQEVQKAKNIFAYVSFRSEVKTLWLIEELMKQQKIVSVPLTHLDEKRMEAISINDISKDLVPGNYGIMEPHPDCAQHNKVEAENIDIVLVPGSAFDERGGRFGYGGGFYDRFLEKIPYAVRVGLAFDLQVVREIPIQPHDELLDYIVTEKRTIEAGERL
ncbi:MAG: 5-formyltetrahydrofolate cyclo-ligase [Desulfopila sp.]|jgi:5-formyltetrahydrofolate cyclo-ligase|nr:5-formyltetrahydrofolate cyclo-ligase [Desulfopila sp.]